MRKILSLTFVALFFVVFAACSFVHAQTLNDQPPVSKRLREIGSPVSVAEAQNIVDQSRGITKGDAMRAQATSGSKTSAPVHDGLITNFRPAENPLLIADIRQSLPAGTVMVTEFRDRSSNQTLILDSIRLDQQSDFGFGLWLWNGEVPNAWRNGSTFTLYISTGMGQTSQIKYEFRPSSDASAPDLSKATQIGSLLKLEGRFPKTSSTPLVAVFGSRIPPEAIVGWDRSQILIDLSALPFNPIGYGFYNLFSARVGNQCVSLLQKMDFPGFIQGVGVSSSTPVATEQSAAAPANASTQNITTYVPVVVPVPVYMERHRSDDLPSTKEKKKDEPTGSPVPDRPQQ
jgi:hypothetical protein